MTSLYLYAGVVKRACHRQRRSEKGGIVLRLFFFLYLFHINMLARSPYQLSQGNA